MFNYVNELKLGAVLIMNNIIQLKISTEVNK